jgi:hypothetical protein
MTKEKRGGRAAREESNTRFLGVGIGNERRAREEEQCCGELSND